MKGTGAYLEIVTECFYSVLLQRIQTMSRKILKIFKFLTFFLIIEFRKSQGFFHNFFRDKYCPRFQIVRLAFLESPFRKWQEDANLWEIKFHFLCKLHMLSVGGMGEGRSESEVC